MEYNKRRGNRDYIVYLNKIKVKRTENQKNYNEQISNYGPPGRGNNFDASLKLVLYRLHSKLVFDRWCKKKKKKKKKKK